MTDETNLYKHKYTQWSFDALQDVSRTFALSLNYLPSPLRMYSSASYLLCRIPDTVEDSDKLTPSEKSTLLTSYVKVMENELDPADFQQQVQSTLDLSESEVRSINDDWNLVMDTHKIHELFNSFDEDIQEAMRPWVIELTEGMRMFIERYNEVGGMRLQDEEELEEYCYYVAGTVGHLLADIVATHYEVEVGDSLHNAAERYGLILQFVNISKDVHSDYLDENNVYLPIQKLKSKGVDPSGVVNSDNSTPVGDVVLDILDSAEDYSQEAHKFLNWFQDVTTHEGFVGFALPYLLAIATIRDLRENSELAVEPEEVKITKDEVLSISRALTESDDVSISEYERSILSKGFVPEQ